MCRLFGFRSIIHSQVHQSLVHAENALGVQSVNHPDGWGVAYYISGSPHLVKSEQAAWDDRIFERVSGVVSSETVIAHLRKATQGQINILNTHPFQFGNWVFAHNGNIKDFGAKKQVLLNNISPSLKRFILGDTDSELIFYFILNELSKHVDLSEKNCDIDELSDAVNDAVKNLISLVGPYSKDENLGDKETYLTFILSNDSSMIAHQGGKPLFYSTYKNKCRDRDTCPSFAPECEAPTTTGNINHLIFSSEPLSGDNIWIPLEPGDIVGVDHRMKLHLRKNKEDKS